MRTCHFTSNKKQKRAFYLTVVRSMFEHYPVIWHPVSKNKLYEFEYVFKRKLLNGYMGSLLTITPVYKHHNNTIRLTIQYKAALTTCVHK